MAEAVVSDGLTGAERLRNVGAGRAILRSAWCSAVLIFFVAALNIAGIVAGLYWSVSWYGYAMHTLGGFSVGSLILLILRKRRGVLSALGGPLRLFVSMGGVALAGVLWELFEFLLGGISRFGPIQLSIADTMGDLAFDLAGGAIFAALAIF